VLYDGFDSSGGNRAVLGEIKVLVYVKNGSSSLVLVGIVVNALFIPINPVQL